MSPAVLLVGTEAELLAPRLEISGYAPLCASQLPLGGFEEVSSGASGSPSNGAQAGTPSPQAVILSPGSDRQIAALRQRWGAIPLLLGIDQDTVDQRCHTLTSGADDFWLCSLGPSDLLMRLRLHLDLTSRANVPAQLLQVGDLVLNPSTRQVKRGARPVGLSAREYQLLLLLLERKGTVVSRELISRSSCSLASFIILLLGLEMTKVTSEDFFFSGLFKPQRSATGIVHSHGLVVVHNYPDPTPVREHVQER